MLMTTLAASSRIMMVLLCHGEVAHAVSYDQTELVGR